MEKTEIEIQTTGRRQGSSSSASEQEGFFKDHHQTMISGLTHQEFEDLKPAISEFHNYRVKSGTCSSILAQRVRAAAGFVWSIVRSFDKPQKYKHFIKSCSVREGFTMSVGDLRDVNVISGLPAATSTERLDFLDEERRVTRFSIIGGDHRLRNYRSVTTVHEMEHDGQIWTVVLESYVVDVPDGNTEEDTRLFADTVVKLNLQKLATVAEALAAEERKKNKVVQVDNGSEGITRKHWTKIEYERLTNEWCKASTNFAFCNDKNNTSFWGLVRKEYNHELPIEWKVRSRDNMCQHFTDVAKRASTFQNKISELETLN